MGGQQIRTAVVGAGAIGGLIAAAAVRAGHAVSVLARGKTLDALRADGIRIVGEESETVARVVADDDATTFGLQDFVVVAAHKVIQTIPVRKPSKEVFVRVHPDLSYSFPAMLLELKETGETYLVDPDLSGPLSAERTVAPKTLQTAITRQGSNPLGN